MDNVGLEERVDWPAAFARLTRNPRAMTLRFQAIVDLQRGKIAGYETLSRFAGPPDLGPDHWFAAAEELGFAHALDAIVVRQALSARRQLPPNCFLTVNVGPKTIVHPDFIPEIREFGSLAGVTIEVTEHESVADYERFMDAVSMLRTMGATFAVDDAGAGYSSLQHILAMRPEFVKIDRVFVDGIDRDPAKLALVEAVGALVGRLDAWVIAEGIERREELAELMRLEVPLAQGYLLARPEEGFAPLPLHVTSMIRQMALARAQRDTVLELIEAATTVRQEEEEEADGAGEWLVEVDSWHRPLRLRGRGSDSWREAMRASAESTPADLARRAITRESGARFDPVSITDEEGRLLGIVRMERLVAALAGTQNRASQKLIGLMERPDGGSVDDSRLRA